MPVSQLGKLRAFRAGCGTDLGQRSHSGLAEVSCFHRGSPLFPAGSGAVVVRSRRTRQNLDHSSLGMQSQLFSAHSRMRKRGRLRTMSPAR